MREAERLVSRRRALARMAGVSVGIIVGEQLLEGLGRLFPRRLVGGWAGTDDEYVKNWLRSERFLIGGHWRLSDTLLVPDRAVIRDATFSYVAAAPVLLSFVGDHAIVERCVFESHDFGTGVELPLAPLMHHWRVSGTILQRVRF